MPIMNNTLNYIVHEALELCQTRIGWVELRYKSQDTKYLRVQTTTQSSDESSLNGETENADDAVHCFVLPANCATSVSCVVPKA